MMDGKVRTPQFGRPNGLPPAICAENARIPRQKKQRPNGRSHEPRNAEKAKPLAQSPALFTSWMKARMASAKTETEWAHLANTIIDGHALGEVTGEALRHFFGQCRYGEIKRHVRMELSQGVVDFLIGSSRPKHNGNGVHS